MSETAKLNKLVLMCVEMWVVNPPFLVIHAGYHARKHT